MKNTLSYKGYIGSIELSESDNTLYGKVLGIRSLLSYEGVTVKELIDDFHGVIDDYLALCQEENLEPEKSYKGSFNVRIGSTLHKEAALYALENNITLNQFIEEAVKEKLLIKH